MEAEQEALIANLNASCPNCHVFVGEQHERLCTVARCLHNGEQAFQHQADNMEDRVHTDGRCELDVWTGYFPGELEAALMGFWCYEGLDADTDRLIWVQCSSNHPQAVPDINRYYQETVFHPIEKIRVLKQNDE